MRISGRLSDTTLGDVLGTLKRARVTGLIRLTETSGPTGGRTHCIYLAQGLVVAVETSAILMPLGEILRQKGLLDGAADRQLALQLASTTRRTGDILVEEKLIARSTLGAALRHQVRLRLDALFRLTDASISFHVACPPPSNAVAPLTPDEYLRGRPRARDRRSGPSSARCGAPSARCGAPSARCGAPSARCGASSARSESPSRAADTRTIPAWRAEALKVLGLPQEADGPEVSRAFRRLARNVHPDGLPGATEAERKAAEHAFARLSAAYHALLGSAQTR